MNQPDRCPLCGSSPTPRHEYRDGERLLFYPQRCSGCPLPVECWSAVQQLKVKAGLHDEMQFLNSLLLESAQEMKARIAELEEVRSRDHYYALLQENERLKAELAAVREELESSIARLDVNPNDAHLWVPTDSEILEACDSVDYVAEHAGKLETVSDRSYKSARWLASRVRQGLLELMRAREKSLTPSQHAEKGEEKL